MPSFLSWGTTPHPSDTINTLLKRIALSITGGAANANMSGHGSPLGVVTPNAQDIWYRDVDTDNYWWATGATDADWTAVV